MVAKFLSLALVLAASSAAAQSLDAPRWYGAFDFGGHWPGSINSSSTGSAPDGKPYDWQWRFRSDWALAARLGYRLTRHVRVEGEFSFEPTDVASAHAPGADVGGVSASRPGEPWGLCQTPPAAGACAPLNGPNKYFTADYAGMANVIYDVTPDRRIDPFFGVGFGATHIQMHTTYWFSATPGSTVSTPQSLELAGTLTHAGELALQGLAGLSYRIAPRVQLDVTYRYYFTPGDVIWNPLNLTTGVPAASLLRPGNFSGQFADQSAMMGVRYAF